MGSRGCKSVKEDLVVPEGRMSSLDCWNETRLECEADNGVVSSRWTLETEELEELDVLLLTLVLWLMVAVDKFVVDR